MLVITRYEIKTAAQPAAQQFWGNDPTVYSIQSASPY